MISVTFQKLLENGKINNKPLYYNYSGGCGLTYAIRMYGLYFHSPLDWVFSNENSYDLNLLESDLKTNNFIEEKKNFLSSCGAIFSHEDINDENIRNHILRKLVDLREALKSETPPKPLKCTQSYNGRMFNAVEKGDAKKLRELFIYAVEWSGYKDFSNELRLLEENRTD